MTTQSCLSRLATLASLASLLLVAACSAPSVDATPSAPDSRGESTPSSAAVAVEPTGTVSLGVTNAVAVETHAGCPAGSQSEIEGNDAEVSATFVQPGVVCGTVGSDEDGVDVLRVLAPRGVIVTVSEGA